MISGCNKIRLVYRRSEIESLQFGTKWEKLCEIIYFVAYTVCYTQLSFLGSSIAIAIMEKLNIDGVSRDKLFERAVVLGGRRGDDDER